MKTLSALLIVTLFTVGCTVGPNYKRPTVDVPGGYRGAAPSEETPQAATPSSEDQTKRSAAQSLGDEKWWRFSRISNSRSSSAPR